MYKWESLPRVLAGLGEQLNIDVAFSMPRDASLASYCMQVASLDATSRVTRFECLLAEGSQSDRRRALTLPLTSSFWRLVRSSHSAMGAYAWVDRVRRSWAWELRHLARRA